MAPFERRRRLSQYRLLVVPRVLRRGAEARWFVASLELLGTAAVDARDPRLNQDPRRAPMYRLAAQTRGEMVSSHGESKRLQEGLMIFIAFQCGYEALAGLALHTVIKIIPRTPKERAR